MNPLDRYRKSEPKGKEPDEREPYKAFQVASGSQSTGRLELRKKVADRAPAYQHLIDLMFDHTGQEIALIYMHLGVKITGKNLHHLKQHLIAGMVAWVQLYEPGRWDKPPEADAIITGIEIFRHDALPQPDLPERAKK